MKKINMNAGLLFIIVLFAASCKRVTPADVRAEIGVYQACTKGCDADATAAFDKFISSINNCNRDRDAGSLHCNRLPTDSVIVLADPNGHGGHRLVHINPRNICKESVDRAYEACRDSAVARFLATTEQIEKCRSSCLNMLSKKFD